MILYDRVLKIPTAWIMESVVVRYIIEMDWIQLCMVSFVFSDYSSVRLFQYTIKSVFLYFASFESHVWVTVCIYFLTHSLFFNLFVQIWRHHIFIERPRTHQQTIKSSCDRVNWKAHCSTVKDWWQMHFSVRNAILQNDNLVISAKEMLKSCKRFIEIFSKVSIITWVHENEYPEFQSRAENLLCCHIKMLVW